MVKRLLIGVCVALLGANIALCDGIRLSNGLKVISVHPAREPSAPSAELGIAAVTTPHSQPPMAGFSPFVAITTSDRASSEDFDWEHHIESSYVGRPLNAPAEQNFVVGLLDTGASMNIVAGSSAETLGLVGRYLTNNVTEVGGVGGTMEAIISQPIGFFAAGLGAVGADGRLDLTRVVGHTNVSVLAAPPIVCGDVEAVTAALGSPLLAFRSTEIRVDRPQKAVVGEQVYVGPDIVIRPSYDPSVTDYPRRIPLEIGGLMPVTTASYYALFDPFDENWEMPPSSPTALSMFALSMPTGGAFFTEMGVLQGEPGPLNTLQNLRVMVDTGAQASILSPNVVARLNLPIEPDFVTVTCGIGGESEAPGYYIDYVRINALGGVMEFSRVPFVILDVQSPEGGSLDGIVGMNFFYDRNIIVAPSITGAGFLHVSDPVPYAYIDLNFDDIIDVMDFAVFASAWGTTPADPTWNSWCDFYMDEVIDARDLNAFVDSWVNMLGQ